MSAVQLINQSVLDDAVISGTMDTKSRPTPRVHWSIVGTRQFIKIDAMIGILLYKDITF